MPIFIMIALVNMTGIGIVLPLFPLIKLKFQVADSDIGLVAAIFSVFMILGSMIFGILSDRIGRKKCTYYPLLGAGIGYIFMGFAETFSSFLILRAVVGFFSGNFVVAFAGASDLSSKATRVKSVGLIGAAAGMGFVIGPVFGGYLASGSAINLDFHIPFLFSGILCIITSVIIIFFSKETLSKVKLEEKAKSVLLQIKETYDNKKIKFFTILNIIFIAQLAGFQVFLGIFLNEKLNFSAQYIGIYWSFFAIAMILGQILIVPKIKKINNSIIISFFIVGIAYLMLTFPTSMPLLVLATVVLAMSVAVLTSAINGSLSLMGGEGNQGLIFAITQSVANIGRIIGPFIIGHIYSISNSLAWVFLTCVCFAISFFMYTTFWISVKRIKSKRKKLKDF